MLHLIFQLSKGDPVLRRIDSGDDIVLHENAVFRVYKDNQLADDLQKMLKIGVNFYVLSDELRSRGITIDELILGVNIIDYSGLVALTEKNKVILTWR